MAGKKRGRPRKARTYAGRPAAVSLCWYCRNAVPSPETGAGCSWSERPHEPVRGWVAERRDLQIQKEGRRHQTCGVESYRVLACPEFEEG